MHWRQSFNANRILSDICDQILNPNPRIVWMKNFINPPPREIQMSHSWNSQIVENNARKDKFLKYYKCKTSF